MFFFLTLSFLPSFISTSTYPSFLVLLPFHDIILSSLSPFFPFSCHPYSPFFTGDPLPQVEFEFASYSVDESSQQVEIAIVLEGMRDPSQFIGVIFSTSNGTAICKNGNNYTSHKA